ncbi:MAG TPA: amidohydrolase family protein [Gemmatimonadales bacterium]|nr:amidohydrolase family protein [Gemmatimonadales bacterium]
MIDVNVFVGSYPWRRVPGTSPEAVLAAMERVGVLEAWVTHLPSLFWKDPGEGNGWLYETAERFPPIRPVPVVHPGLPRWERDLGEAVERGSPAIRCDPGFLGITPVGSDMLNLVARAGEAGMPVMAAVRLEDGRGRHPLDLAPELTPHTVRTWVRSSPTARLVITHADREFIEQVHFGATPEEAARIWWDISWVWGPPEEHLALLLATIGGSRFLFGSGQPLRLAETPLARLDLLDLSPEDRRAILTENAQSLALRKPAAP